MTRAIFKSACRCSRAIRAGRWVDERGPAMRDHRHRVGQAGCVGGAGGERGPARRDELRGQESRRAGLSFLESVPDVSAKLKEPVTADRKFEDVVKSAQQATVLVLVY